MRGTFKQTTNASFCNILSNYNLSRLGDLFDCFVKRTRTKPRRNKTTSSKSTRKECIREAFQKKKKDKLGLLAQPRGGRGRKGLGVPNPLNRFIKICLK